MFSELINRKNAREKFAEMLQSVKGEDVITITSRFSEHDDHVVMTKQNYDHLKDIQSLFADMEKPSQSFIRLSERLTKILKMLEDIRFCNRKLSPERISEEMGFENFNAIEGYQNGKSEISYAILDKLADKYGLNARWVKTGEGNAYNFAHFDYSDFYEIRKYMITKNFKKILCLKCDNEWQNVYTFIGDGELKWEKIGRDVHFSSHVGGSGQNQLFNFFKFATYFQISTGLSTFHSVSINENEWSLLENGDLHPGVFYHNIHRYRPLNWIDDLDEIHNIEKHERLGVKYGIEYLNALNIITYILKAENLTYNTFKDDLIEKEKKYPCFIRLKS